MHLRRVQQVLHALGRAAGGTRERTAGRATRGGRRTPWRHSARAIEAPGPGRSQSSDSFSQDVSVPLMPAVTVKIPAPSR